jgi:hypothetical protein
MKKNVVQFANDVLGISLYPAQAEALMAMAVYQLVALACGRRGGKSLLAAIWAVYDCTMRDLRKYQRKGETRYVLLVAASVPQARALFRTVADMCKAPMVAPLVVGEPTNDEIRLANNTVLRVVPCSSRSPRGLAASTVIFEELASYQDTNGYQSGDAVYRALEPSVSQFLEHGRIIALSSPRGQRGTFWNLHERAKTSEVGFAMNLPTWELNPSIDRASLARIEDEDPDLFAQEYRASFTAIGGAYFHSGKLAEATQPLPEHDHGTRVLALDPAFSQDDFGLAIACVPAHDETIVYIEHVEALRRPGFNAAMDYAAGLAKDWDVTRVVTDQMSSQAVVEELGKRGVTCHPVPWTGRSASGRSKPHRYGRVKQLLNQGRLILPDNAELRSEFTEVAVRESATDPGFQIETHGPDDQLDASIMAITEALKPKRPNSVVHDFGPGEVVIPAHQRHLGTFYGSKVPVHAIDKD